jgi:hypothetical protein
MIAVRRLPSIDWIAIGIGLASLILQYRWIHIQWVAVVAVLLPSVLREVGVLKDADEFTLGVARRAGFHALAFIAALFLLGLSMSRLGVDAVNAGGETLLMRALVVFLVSYLVQYWGAREGVFRILLGMAAMSLAAMAGFLGVAFEPGYLLIPLGSFLGGASLLTGLALLVRARPRLGARALILLTVLLALLLGCMALSPRLLWGSVLDIIQVGLVFGCTGGALLREPPSGNLPREVP